jgi:hypothetical protein
MLRSLPVSPVEDQVPGQVVRSMLALQVVHTDRDHIVGTWRNVFVCMWRHETHAQSILNLKPVIQRLKSTNPAGIAMLTIVEPNADLPTPQARDELPKLFKQVAKGISCSALVFEGVGFRAAAIRALTTTFNMVAAQPFPHKVFGSVQDAEAMFTKLLPESAKGEQLRRGELILAVNGFRARFNAWTEEFNRV